MVKREYWEQNKLKFKFCEYCPFNECELIEEYELFSKNHYYPMEHEGDEELRDANSGYFIGYIKSKDADSYEKNRNKLNERTAVVDNFGRKISLSYNKKEFENGCIMGCRHVYQIECGRKTVTEGIGDHYKVEITEKFKKKVCVWEKIIKEDTEDRWEPLQPVFISAQTGQGKNYFVENALIPYVRKLNYEEKTSYKVLILSNRLALKQQIKNRIDGNDDLDNEEGKIYSYGKFADVMTYQSLLLHEQNLKKRQKYAESRYIYVICDEAHFFTSDAMFNPHTQKILQMIVRLFQDAVRVYMSATPYECLEYIIKCEGEEREKLNLKKYGHNQFEWKYGKMVFYHFKRDYSYLDVKTYSFINELYGEIVESVSQRKEKWLIFIDDIEKCAKVKEVLEKVSEDMKCPLKVEEDGSRKKVEKVFVVNANSKRDPIYQEILSQEKLNKDTYVLISTSVLDNGVNLTGIKNIVVSDMEKSKCLQMVGRARVSEGNEHKTLYVKRFCADEVDKRLKNLMRQQDAYHSYELAYDENGNVCGPGIYQFVNKYYSGKEADWKEAKHWFGISFEETKWHLNEIAKSLMEKLIPQYQFIYDEMKEEELKGDNAQGSGCISHTGQKYLEYQLSWFGKKYCEDDDITFADKEKSKKEFIAFLEVYADNERQIDKNAQRDFRASFTKLHDDAFGRRDRNKGRQYSINVMNASLEEESINYKIVSHSSYWIVEKCNWEIEDIE